MVGNELPDLRLEIAYDLFLCHLSVAGNISAFPKVYKNVKTTKFYFMIISFVSPLWEA